MLVTCIVGTMQLNGSNYISCQRELLENVSLNKQSSELWDGESAWMSGAHLHELHTIVQGSLPSEE